jgi:hypothetical protein
MKSVSATKPALTRREINRMPPKSDVPDALLDTFLRHSCAANNMIGFIEFEP